MIAFVLGPTGNPFRAVPLSNLLLASTASVGSGDRRESMERRSKVVRVAHIDVKYLSTFLPPFSPPL